MTITVANVISLLKAVFYGLIAGGIWYISQVVSSPLNSYISRHDYEYFALGVCAVYVISLGGYLYAREFHLFCRKIFLSRRIDIVLGVITGAAISIVLIDFPSELIVNVFKPIGIIEVICIAALPLVIGLMLVLRNLQLKGTLSNKDSFFMSDAEIEQVEGDLLNFDATAQRFAARIFNNGSPDSFVFGIDAPWGVGKSSFVNFCEKYWEENHKEEVVLFRFNPLRYENESNLLEKFIDELVHTIQKNSFQPEIRPLASKYSRFISRPKLSFSRFGINFDLFPGTYSIDDALSDLKATLATFDKKIIVVVDDLDRLNFSAIKDVLFAIKKSFSLPNMSYVLCYDAENISILEKEKKDLDKITEFLEKFVNVKLSLYLDSDKLIDYVSKDLDKARAQNPFADANLISTAMGGLVDIYKSKDFHEYTSFAGDIRKIKRLINTLLLLEVEQTDFKNSDFDKKDLIHLLLIYINYPNIFRKIYDTETQGRRGFFSVILPHEKPLEQRLAARKQGESKNEYENSDEYKDYIENLTDRQRFLLKKIFSVTDRLGKVDKTKFAGRSRMSTEIDSVPQEIKNSYACFNGEGGWTGGHNLEEYLKLIVHASKPESRTQYRLYLNCKDEVLAGTEIQEIFSRNEFIDNEFSHAQFWNVIVNSLSEITHPIGSKIIEFLLKNIPNYSFYTNKILGLGLRDDLNFHLIQILDRAGWKDENGRHEGNTEENITEIAEWIFGEGRHTGDGVLKALSETDRGVLGLYDLLVFRLHCSADRGGDTFNLQRSLVKHGDPEAPTEGNTGLIAIAEMREMTQNIFQTFKSRYIEPQLNLFKEVSKLEVKNVTGQYYDLVKDKIAAGELENIEKEMAELRSRVLSFCLYQLGNTLISHGVGTGYYDEVGNADKNGISKQMNDYLFDVCFNPVVDESNYEHFLDYLLMNFGSFFAREGRQYKPSLGEVTTVLDRKRLVDYWKINQEEIRTSNFPAKDKKVITMSYTAVYKTDLEEVYKTLDTLVEEVDKEASKAAATEVIVTSSDADPVV